MPKSKRARPVFLHGPKKKTKEDKESLITNVRAALEKFQYVYVLEVKNMRNTYLKDVRQEFSDDGRIFFGKTTLLSVSLGTTPSTAPLPGLDNLSPYLKTAAAASSSTTDQTQTCLLLTNRSPDLVRQYFSTFHPLDYARAGTPATRSFHVPRGEIWAPPRASAKDDAADEGSLPVTATREPELRKSGVPTRLVKGKVICESEEGEGYIVCREGQVLDSRQTAILKFFGEKMAVFEVGIRACWSGATGEVEEEGTMELDEAET